MTLHAWVMVLLVVLIAIVSGIVYKLNADTAAVQEMYDHDIQKMRDRIGKGAATPQTSPSSFH